MLQFQKGSCWIVAPPYPAVFLTDILEQLQINDRYVYLEGMDSTRAALLSQGISPIPDVAPGTKWPKSRKYYGKLDKPLIQVIKSGISDGLPAFCEHLIVCTKGSISLEAYDIAHSELQIAQTEITEQIFIDKCREHHVSRRQIEI